MSPVATKSKYVKISKSYILTPPLGACDTYNLNVSVRCGQPSDELLIHAGLATVSPPKLLSLLHFFCKRDGIMDKRTDGQKDRQFDYYIVDAPAGYIKMYNTIELIHRDSDTNNSTTVDIHGPLETRGGTRCPVGL